VRSDDLAIAFNTGAVDARQGLPRRVDFPDATPREVAAYHDGYDNPPAWRYSQ
jgi:hypothetical protein